MRRFDTHTFPNASTTPDESNIGISRKSLNMPASPAAYSTCLPVTWKIRVWDLSGSRSPFLPPTFIEPLIPKGLHIFCDGFYTSAWWIQFSTCRKHRLTWFSGVMKCSAQILASRTILFVKLAPNNRLVLLSVSHTHNVSTNKQTNENSPSVQTKTTSMFTKKVNFNFPGYPTIA